MDKIRKQTMQTQLRLKETTRRDFIRNALAVGVSLPLSMSMARQVFAATPKKGGIFRQAITGGSTTDVLDPAQVLDMYMANVSYGQIRNNLTEISADGSLVGELAESWESSSDARTWTFEIRKGIEFHNGKTLDAHDVVASLNHHRGEDSTSAAKSIVEAVVDVRADGSHVVVIDLSGGSADFPFLLSDFHLSICPAKEDGGIDWESGVGTGGYILESFDPGVRTVTKRNPNYWKENRAHFDGIETLFIADVGARTSGILSDSLDAITRVDLKTINLLERNPNIKIIQTTGNQHYTLPMLTDTAPYDNNELRLALKYAIDREKWKKVIVRDYGKLANDHPIGPGNRYYDGEIEQRAYDPDKAKFHLKRAGYDSIDLDLHVAETAFEGATDGAQLVQDSAREAGININIVREPNDGYWSNVWQQKPWCASYWAGRATEDWMFSLVYASGAPWNESHWSNEKFDRLLLQARAELDSNKRRDMYGEMQRLVRDEGGSVIPIYASFVQAISNNVHTPEELGNNLEFDGHKNAERWWFGD